MSDTYSLYEAKAKLSAIVRRVREGCRAIVTVHGKPVAEIRQSKLTSLGRKHAWTRSPKRACCSGRAGHASRCAR